MGKSAERLKKRLQAAIDSGEINKITLHRKTGIQRASIDGYLAGAVPDLDVLDKISDALNCDPWESIKPEGEPVLRPHTLKDCLTAVAEVVNASIYAKPAMEVLGYTSTPTQNQENKLPRELEELFSQLSEKEQKRRIRLWKEELQLIVKNPSSKKEPTG